MGCWNGTCGLSQLPILAGDDVWGFLIGVKWHRYSDSGDQSGYCYPTDIGFPMSLPIYGKYNDYGGMEEIKESYNTKIIMETYGEDYNNIKDFINDCVERDEFFLFDDYIDKYGVGLFMVHANLIGDLKTVNRSYEKDTVYNIAKKDGKMFFEEAPLLVDKPGSFVSSMNHKYRFCEFESIGCNSKYKINNNMFVHAFSKFGIGNCLVDTWEPYRTFIIEFIKNNECSSTIANEIIEDVANLKVVEDAMHGLRKSWIPQSGKGSQSQEFELYWKLTTAMRRYINREVNKMKEWDKNE